MKKRAEKEIKIRTTIKEGTAWEEIVNEAKESKCDLIIMDPKGKTGVAKALIGSAAENVIRYAHCPVFSVSSLIR